MKLTCYTVTGQPSPLEPGKPDRDWMDIFTDRHPYRCLPLVVANTTGWELISPVSFTASWNGKALATDIRIDPDEDTTKEELAAHVVSHFSGGVLTFHTGYLFRTEPGWDLWVGGPPNHLKDGIQPLTGVVETDWLPFPFTMNWHFTRPGMVSFKKGEPYALIMPIPHAAIDEIEPIVKRIDEDAELNQAYADWAASREGFLEKLQARDEEARKRAWQRDYFRGRTPQGVAGPDSHINRRRVKPPRPARKDE